MAEGKEDVVVDVEAVALQNEDERVPVEAAALRNEDERVPVEAAALRESMNNRLWNFNYVCKRSELRSIFRVPPYIRDQNKSDYDPRLTSIGPYHHGTLALQNEPLKWRYLVDLIARSVESNSLNKYINAIFKREPEIRDYYSEDIVLKRDALVEMMVLDGCFIVEFLIKQYLGEKDICNGAVVKWNLKLLQHDLLLLENQIPFLVLEEIFNNSILLPKSTIPEPFRQLNKDITLVELATAYVAFDSHKAIERLRRDSSSRPPVTDPHHLLHLCHQSFDPKSIRQEPGDKEGQSAPKTVRSATELKDAGLKFRRRNKDADGFNLLDVTFRGGTMEIPELSIREATPSWLRNLLAFEQCCPTAGSYFTSYTALLNNLIDTPNDVAVLKKYDIIKSKLGGDDDVAKLFNEICRGAYLDDDHHFVQLFKDVRRYSETAHHRWRARLVHDYFESPWAIISVGAAITLLCLTLVQTFFTIFPYFHPRS